MHAKRNGKVWSNVSDRDFVRMYIFRSDYEIIRYFIDMCEITLARVYAKNYGSNSGLYWYYFVSSYCPIV